jgi:hypothetical protein
MAFLNPPASKDPSIADSRRPIRLDSFLTTSFWGQLLVAVLIAFSFLTLYLLTRTRYYTFDAVSYAQQILTYRHTGNLYWIFHPHHLLFNGLGLIVWRISAFFGYRGGPLEVILTTNAFLGAFGLALFYLTLRRILTRSHTLAVLLTGALGCSFGYWICATDARVNMPSITALIAATLALVWTIQSPNRARAITAGCLAGLAALLHESAILYLVVGWTGVALSEYPQGDRKEERRARAATLGYFTGAWLVTFVVPYVLVGTVLLHLQTLIAYRAWASRYAELGWWWSFDVSKNLRLDIYGIRRALFVEPAGKSGTFHVTKSKDEFLQALYFLSLGGWITAIYFFITAIPLLIKTHYRPYLILAIVWLLAYISFFTFWSPEYFVFWVPVIVTSCIIFALSASPLRARRKGWLWMAAILLWILCIGCSNYYESIKPHQWAYNNPYLVQANDIRKHTHSGDIVIVSGCGDEASAEVYIPYFAKRYVFAIHTEMERRKDNQTLTRTALLQVMQKCRNSGGRVYGLNELWNSKPVQQELLERHKLSVAGLAKMFAGQKIETAWKDPRGIYVWIVVPQ